MKGDETFRVRTTCPANDRAQKPVRVNREKPPCDLKEAVSRLSILRCSRVRHPRSSSMLVTLDVLFSGLYLGYLRGRRFPTKKCSAPPPPPPGIENRKSQVLLPGVNCNVNARKHCSRKYKSFSRVLGSLTYQ